MPARSSSTRRPARAAAAALALCAIVAGAACGPALPDLAPDTEKLRAAGAEALSTNAKQCTTLRKGTEPDLFGWDSGSRGKVKATAEQGLVLVHFEEHGCDITISVLNCTSTKAAYRYTPRHAQQTRIAENDVDLYAHFPIAVADLRARLGVDRGIRADYRVEGIDMMPIGVEVSHADLKGSECAAATHVVSAIHRGAFAVAAGTLTDLHAGGTLFDASLKQRLGVFDGDGFPEACDGARARGTKASGCDEPLRIELLPLGEDKIAEAAAEPAAPAPMPLPPVAKPQPAKPQPAKVARAKPPAKQQVAAQPRAAHASGPPRLPEGAKPTPELIALATELAQTPSIEPEAPALVAAPRSVSASGESCPSSMVEIVGGSFLMGSDEGRPDERPAHRVTVGRFCMDRTPVTVEAYARCESCSRPDTGGFCNGPEQGKDRHPQNCVSWHDAMTYCISVGKILPTEAEWEYAARGGRAGSTYPWGESLPTSESVCWNRQSFGQLGTCEVGAFPSGAFGLSDMAGNVWEWTADWYQSYSGPRATWLVGRALRGGAWISHFAESLRSTARKVMAPANREDHIGFRCAMPR